MSESIYDSGCPFCKTRNYYSNGDPSDLSKTDVDTIKCCKCKKDYPVEGWELVYDEPFEQHKKEYAVNIADGFLWERKK